MHGKRALDRLGRIKCTNPETEKIRNKSFFPQRAKAKFQDISKQSQTQKNQF
jgi:hypothetical protein